MRKLKEHIHFNKKCIKNEKLFIFLIRELKILNKWRILIFVARRKKFAFALAFAVKTYENIIKRREF